MKQRFLNKTPILLILLVTLLFANLQANKRSGKDACWNICGDERGYYAWLPAIFIYHDLNFHFTDSVEKIVPDCGIPDGFPVAEYRYDFKGKLCDKYYPGTSLLMSPFFAIAHIYTKYCTNRPANGYSIYYFRIMAISGVFYYLAGMLFFLGMLTLLGLNNLQKCLTILFITFGSNMIYNVIDTPLGSHIYSFTLMAAFIYFSLLIKDTLKARYLVYMSLLAGLIFITRPVDMVILLFLPFLLWEKKGLIISYFQQKPLRISFLLPGIIMPLALFSLYKISAGSFFLYSYKNEKFDFLHPHLWQFLFHYDNGILPYTPILFMPFLFLFAWYKKENKALLPGIAVTLAVIIYINASWWFWQFGLCFGSRTMVDFLPLFGIALALSIKQSQGFKHYAILAMYLLCSGFTMMLYSQKTSHGYMKLFHITDYWDAIYNALGIK